MYIFKRYSFLLLLAVIFCGRGGGGNPASSNASRGAIEVRTRVVSRSLAKAAAEAGASATVAESLVVVVSGAGIAEPIRRAQRVDLSRPSQSAVFSDIPAGSGRSVVITGVGRDGAAVLIDSVAAGHTVTVTAGGVAALLNATLIPAVGAIYLQFTGLDVGSTVYAEFVFGGDIRDMDVTRTSSNPRPQLSLDNIPHGASGTLTVIICDANGDTLRTAVQQLVFDARSDKPIELRFDDEGGDDDGDGDDGSDDMGNGSVSLDITVYTPGVTLGVYDFNKPGSGAVVEESGELVITEIMWNAANSNYAEIHNPSDAEVYFDTLLTEVDGTVRRFVVDVTFPPRGYVVIGRTSAAPSVNYFPPASTNFNITSNGNWVSIMRKDGTLIDRVIFATGVNNATGWPSMAATTSATAPKYSIELDSGAYSATQNNYGKNWRQTSGALIDGTNYYGTPGH